MWRYPDIPILARPEILPVLEAQGGWLCQYKYNGWRCILEWTGSALTWTSRHRKGLAGAVTPELASETLAWASKLPAETILDCEMLGRRDDVRVKGLVVFDVLAWGGESFIGFLNTQDRFNRIPFGGPDDGPRVVECQSAGFLRMFESARNNPSVEGVVLKRATAPYIGSVRRCAENPGWLKVKFRGGEDGNLPIA